MELCLIHWTHLSLALFVTAFALSAPYGAYSFADTNDRGFLSSLSRQEERKTAWNWKPLSSAVCLSGLCFPAQKALWLFPCALSFLPFLAAGTLWPLRPLQQMPPAKSNPFSLSPVIFTDL